MKIFISYRFTGETKEDLEKLLFPLKRVFEQRGIEVYCNFFDKDLSFRSKDYKPQDYVFDAFRTLSTADFMFVVLKSSEKSEGMILEVGYAIAKGIPVIVAVKEDVKNTYLPGMATKMFTWGDLEDLIEKTKHLEVEGH